MEQEDTRVKENNEKTLISVINSRFLLQTSLLLNRKNVEKI